MKVIVTPIAEGDLVRIGDYIAADNPVRARSFVRELRKKVREIGEQPRAFPLVPRYEHTGVRRRLHGEYLIFYVIVEECVYVVHILNGAMDYERVLFPAG